LHPRLLSATSLVGLGKSTKVGLVKHTPTRSSKGIRVNSSLKRTPALGLSLAKG
jgi:hypothetical protein